ncbi:uncharacterized protein LOC117521587 isoform X2 [Thalassophryne amazonica]|uniref:uncharacterized protein LOC117521587 isoform X2 n=1 Tax=Thalassophryne amazonica TaxID=390379 RepID=UPI0014710818|nr:uncharacterized protein LOC117521587 isoform X2 [Thalassophryne amazonica]
MRAYARQQLAAWLRALPIGGARRGRLEMISFWLLCWKLLRATAGLSKTTAELMDSNHSDGSSNSSTTPIQPTSPITMETSSPSLTDSERQSVPTCCSEEPLEPDHSGVHGADEPFTNQEAVDGEQQGCDQDTVVFKMEALERGEEGGSKGPQDLETGTEEQEAEGRAEKEDLKNREDKKQELEVQPEEREGAEEEIMTECSLSEELISSDSPRAPTAGDDHQTTSQQHPESVLSEGWECDSDNREDFIEGQPSECLLVDLIVVRSDASENQWVAVMPCDVMNEEEETESTDEAICDGKRKPEGNGGDDEEKGEREVTVKDEQREEEVKKGWTDEEHIILDRGVLPRSPSVSSLTSSADSYRRETHGENVSTEHLDFLLARQQWKKMEEQFKDQPIPKPGLKAHNGFHGTHSSIYPPTRSPRLKRREIHNQVHKEPPLSSTLSPSSEDSGLDDSSFRSHLEDTESAVEREIRLTLEREEKHRRERGMIAQGLTIPRPTSIQTGRSPPRPPACRTPTLCVSPSPPCSPFLPQSVYQEVRANNVIILEPDSSSAAARTCQLSPTFSSPGATLLGGSDTVCSTNVIVVETSNLIIRSASEFCLNATPLSVGTQECTFSSNPFFKLRSRSSQSLVDQEIQMVRQREEEWRRQREELWRKRREDVWKKGMEKYDTVLVSPSLSENSTFNEITERCVSSPSSPSKTRKMERSSLSCDYKWFT